MGRRRSGGKAGSSGGARAGKRAAKKRGMNLKDLNPKQAEKVRGGVSLSPIVVTKPVDKSS